MQDGGQQEVKDTNSVFNFLLSSTLMFRIVGGTNKKGRPSIELMDDIVSWCKTRLQELNSSAKDRRRWKLITRQAMDTNGRWSHDS